MPKKPKQVKKRKSRILQTILLPEGSAVTIHPFPRNVIIKIYPYGNQ